MRTFPILGHDHVQGKKERYLTVAYKGFEHLKWTGDSEHACACETDARGRPDNGGKIRLETYFEGRNFQRSPELLPCVQVSPLENPRVAPFTSHDDLFASF
jgi:hypothetical protein